MMGHQEIACCVIQKYQSTVRNVFCDFCKLVGHDKKGCLALDLMRERTTDEYTVQGEEGSKGGLSQYNTLRGYNQGGRGGIRGQGRGGFGR
jgi:hypothetical protein